MPVQKSKQREQKIIFPPKIILESLSSTGLLTLNFSKPIFIPNVIKQILSQDVQNNLRTLQDGTETDIYAILKDIIEIKLVDFDAFDVD